MGLYSMARIFISYSRRDQKIASEYARQLRMVFDHSDVWYDADLHGGKNWWAHILKQIDSCEVFLYLITNTSLKSPHCQAELQYAVERGKQILPIIIAGRFNLRLANEATQRVIEQVQYIATYSLKRGNEGIQLIGTVRRLLGEGTGEYAIPGASVSAPVGGSVRPEDIHFPQPTHSTRPPSTQEPADYTVPIAVATIGLIGGLVAAIIGVIPFFVERQDELNLTATYVAQVATLPATTVTGISIVDIAKTDDANHTATAQAITAEWMASWTDTPTVTLTPTANITASFTASLEAYRAEQPATAEAITAEWIAIRTATPTATASPTATLTPTADPREKTVTSNEEWTEGEIEETSITDEKGVKMVWVPGGCFEMGGDPDAYYPSGEISNGEQCVEGFYLDQYEVTNADYVAFLREVGGNEGRDNIGYLDLESSYQRINGGGSTWTIESGYEKHPVVEVTWYGARDYCEWRGGTLPQEVEWEYASRGPSGKLFPWGDELDTAKAVFNVGGTAEVGSIEAGRSWVGAYDLSGNVWEWMLTDYVAYPYDTKTMINNTNSSRVLRGGSWWNGNAYYLRSSSRSNNTPVSSDSYNGFRCARS